MPTEGSKCKFENHYFKLKLPFVGYADFESINIKVNYMNPDLRKQINKLRIKSKSHNVNSKVKNMIINKLMKEQEISKKKNLKEFTIIIFIKKLLILILKGIYIILKKNILKSILIKNIDTIIDKWIEDGRPIEVSDYEVEKYCEVKEIKIKKLSERLKEKIKRENIKLSLKDNTINLQEQKVVSFNLQLVSQYPDIILN